MNKSHRVLWSQVRNCFVVAGENAKTNGKPSSTRKTIAAAVTSLFLAPGMASAISCPPGQTPVTTALTSTQCYSIDADITVSSGGSVLVTESAGSAIAMDVDLAPIPTPLSIMAALVLAQPQAKW